MTTINPHADCGSAAYKTVTCDRCARTYVCTPADDYYCVAASSEHSCEPCLIGGLPLLVITPEDLKEHP